MNIAFLVGLLQMVIYIECHGQEQNLILFADYKNVYVMDTETRNITTISSGYSAINYVDYHIDKSLIFWSDFDLDTISRIEFPVKEGILPEVIITSWRVLGIAVDNENDFLYWNKWGNSYIYRSNLDGTGTSTIRSVSYPNGIELNHLDSWIYYTDGDGRIMRRCRFDGSNSQTLSTHHPHQMYGFAIDINKTRVIYAYHHQRIISSFPISNTNNRQVIADVSGYTSHVYALAVDSSYIFFAGYGNRTVYRLPRNNPHYGPEALFTGQDITTAVKVFKLKNIYCSRYHRVYNAEKRSIDYKLSSDDTLISDHELEPGWYRVMSQNGVSMATKPPGVNFCGTNYPIWINGSLPETQDKNSTVTACVQTESSICQHSFDVEIIKCFSFYIYYLQNTTKDSAYCFGSGPVRCEEGLSSETGFYPGCSSFYPNETLNPVVTGMLQYGEYYEMGQNKDPSLIPVFHCKFEDVSGGQNYLYDIIWYINENLVAHRKNVYVTDNTTNNLKGDEWSDRYSMNMEVMCAVRLRYGVDSVPSPNHNSPVFHAGLYPENQEYTVVEGESVTIRLTSTMPIGCITNKTDYRSEQWIRQIDAYIPNSYTAKPSRSCPNNAVNGNIIFGSCGITLNSIDEEQTAKLLVYGVSDGLYNSQPRHTYIRMSPAPSTVPEVIDIWSRVNLSEVKVTVVDRDSTLSGRLCQSYNDPHITTFDGKTYHYMAVGEFVIYRNNRGPFWVHALLTNCGFGWSGSSCHCGIAIRSRNSLFVLRTCQTVSRTRSVFLRQPHSEVQSCNAEDLRIIQNGQSYQITLAIGTEIQFTVSSRFISRITIKPSIYDINEARGLCGVPSVTRDPSDDFINRDTDKVSAEKVFADSWRIDPKVRPNEQLFISIPTFETDIGPFTPDNEISLVRSGHFCVCETETSHCNMTEISVTCSGSIDKPSNDATGGFVTSCRKQSIRGKRSTFNLYSGHNIARRSVDDTDDIIDISTFELDEDIVSNDNISIDDAKFRNGWTEGKANEKCSERIKSGNIAKIFGQFGGVSIDDYIDSCILDIKMTATTEFLEDTIGAIKTYILIEVLRNETILNSAFDNGTETILEYITNQLCPRNCSLHGTCYIGICSCFDGFVGDDCSEDGTLPPMNISLPASGLCGKESRACKRTNIFGQFSTQNVSCRIQYSQISNNTVTYIEDKTVKTEYRNPYMVTVNLDMDSRDRQAATETPYLTVYKYDLSLSNDGTTFGESVMFLAFNEKCISCDNTTKTCTIISACPYIETSEPTSVQEQTSGFSLSIWVIVVGSCAVAVVVAIITCTVLGSRNRRRERVEWNKVLNLDNQFQISKKKDRPAFIKKIEDLNGLRLL